MFIPRFWSAIVITILTLPIQASIVLALSPPEISNIAKKSVVRIDGANAGTGFIIEKNGNTYTILTNAHVLKPTGDYQILAPDNRSYRLINKQFHPDGTDLAKADFTSDRDYPVAKLSSSQGLEPGSSIYSYGWNAVSTAIESRTPQLLIGNISSIKSGKAYKGYNLIYTLNRVPGMSGSPIYNDRGEVVGVYGLQDEGSTLTLGISIDILYRNIKTSPEDRTLLETAVGGNLDRAISLRLSRDADKYFQQGDNKYDSAVVIKIETPESRALLEEAIDNFDRAIQISPKYLKAYLGRGMAKYKLGKTTAAIADYYKVLSIDSNYASAFFNIGLAKYSLRDISGALEAMQQAEKLYEQQGKIEDQKEAANLWKNWVTNR